MFNKKFRKLWLILGVVVLVITFLFLLSILPPHTQDKQLNKTVAGEKIVDATGQTIDVFKAIDCMYDPEIHYWSWWE